MVIDFRRKRRSAFQPLSICGRDVEPVEDFKYLGVTINHSPDWRSYTGAVYRKGMSRLYFLRKRRSFNVCSKMLEIFSLWWPVYFTLLWFVGEAASEPATPTDSTNWLYDWLQTGHSGGCGGEEGTEQKLLAIINNPHHPLNLTLVRQQSTFSRRLLQLCCHSSRYRKSFLPQAISLHNNSFTSA